jgi:H+/gluconate symporter-like permease
MTVGYGLGMFVYGMTCILIGALIAYKIINRKSAEERENEKYLKELKKKL